MDRRSLLGAGALSLALPALATTTTTPAPSLPTAPIPGSGQAVPVIRTAPPYGHAEAVVGRIVQDLDGCFVAGTLVNTKDGLKPIEQIKVGDWVLSRPEDPAQGTETGYKRVTKTFRFENKEVVRFWWYRNEGNQDGEDDSVYVTPNHPVWLNPHGWVAVGRLHLPGKRRPGTIHRGDDEWLGRELVLADGSPGGMLDVSDLYRTDRLEIAFHEEDGWGFGTLLDFSAMPPSVGEDMPYDYKNGAIRLMRLVSAISASSTTWRWKTGTPTL